MGSLSNGLRLYCLLKVVVEINTYVLLATDPEDFRKIAKQFVPVPLANKLAKFASRVSDKESEPDQSEDSDYYYETDDEDDVVAENSTDEDDETDLGRSGESNMYVKEWQTRVNLDELVERVKDRLAKELSKKLKNHLYYPTQSLYNTGQVEPHNQLLKQNVDRSSEGDYVKNDYKTYGYNHDSKKKRVPNYSKINNGQSNAKPKLVGHGQQLGKNDKSDDHGKNKRLKTKDYQSTNGYEIEISKESESDYEEKQLKEIKHKEDIKVFLLQENKGVTRYTDEEPKRKPKKEFSVKYKDVYEGSTKTTKKLRLQIKNKNKGKKLEESSEDVALTEQSNTDEKEYVPTKNNVKNPPIYEEFDLISKKTNDSYEEYEIPKVENKYASEETTTAKDKYVRPGKEKLASVKSNEKSNSKAEGKHNNNKHRVKQIKKERLRKKLKEEINPTDDFKESVDKSQEIKAKTESLLFNYDDEPKLLEESNLKAKEMVSSFFTRKKGTMIPTREYYKMSSPNYYISIPTVAEKFDANEPLPEKDRKKEIIKHFVNPPASINKKVKLA